MATDVKVLTTLVESNSATIEAHMTFQYSTATDLPALPAGTDLKNALTDRLAALLNTLKSERDKVSALL